MFVNGHPLARHGCQAAEPSCWQSCPGPHQQPLPSAISNMHLEHAALPLSCRGRRRRIRCRRLLRRGGPRCGQRARVREPGRKPAVHLPTLPPFAVPANGPFTGYSSSTGAWNQQTRPVAFCHPEQTVVPANRPPAHTSTLTSLSSTKLPTRPPTGMTSS